MERSFNRSSVELQFSDPDRRNRASVIVSHSSDQIVGKLWWKQHKRADKGTKTDLQTVWHHTDGTLKEQSDILTCVFLRGVHCPLVSVEDPDSTRSQCSQKQKRADDTNRMWCSWWTHLLSIRWLFSDYRWTCADVFTFSFVGQTNWVFIEDDQQIFFTVFKYLLIDFLSTDRSVHSRPLAADDHMITHTHTHTCTGYTDWPSHSSGYCLSGLQGRDRIERR